MVSKASRYEFTIKNDFLISQSKHMLWALKRTVSMRHSFEHLKQLFKLMHKKILTILEPNFIFYLDA